MKGTVLHALKLTFLLVLAAAISWSGAAFASQAGDAWIDLGESFTDGDAALSADAIVGDTYVLPASGAIVHVADPLEPEQSDMEDQLIFVVPDGLGAIAVLPGLQSPEVAMETYVSAFSAAPGGAELLDMQLDDDSATGLYLVEVSGEPVFLFIIVDNVTLLGYHIVQVALAESEIADSISYLRKNIAVNNQPMFSNVDETEVQEIVDHFLAS